MTHYEFAKLQVKEASVFVLSRKRKWLTSDGKIYVNNLVVHTTSYNVSQHPESRKPDYVSLSSFIGSIEIHGASAIFVLILVHVKGFPSYYFKSQEVRPTPQVDGVSTTVVP